MKESTKRLELLDRSIISSAWVSQAFRHRTSNVFQRTLRDNGASQINEEQLLAAVSEGVSIANRELGASLFVERIEYVPTDTPEYNTYQELAKAIILSAAKDFN